MFVRSFKEQVFQAEVIVIADCTFDEMEKYCVGRWPCARFGDLDQSVGFVLKLVEYGGYTKVLMWLKDPKDIAIFAHEVIHLAQFILGDRGAEDTGETLAYYHTYWFKRIGKALKPVVETI